MTAAKIVYTINYCPVRTTFEENSCYGFTNETIKLNASAQI